MVVLSKGDPADEADKGAYRLIGFKGSAHCRSARFVTGTTNLSITFSTAPYWKINLQYQAFVKLYMTTF